MITYWKILQEDGTKVWVPAEDVRQGLHQRAVVLRHGRDRDALMDDLKTFPKPAVSLADYADSVLKLHLERACGPAEIFIAKSRNTQTGIAKLMLEEPKSHITLNDLKQRTVPKQ